MTTSSKEPHQLDLLTSLSEAPPANPFQSPEGAEDWTTTVATWPDNFAKLLTSSSPVGSSGKMSLASCQATPDGTLEPLRGRWLRSGILSPTESWTLNTSIAPQDASASLLSDVKEPTGDHLQQYYLTARQAQTYKRREITAPLRLPEPLKVALTQVARIKTPST